MLKETKRQLKIIGLLTLAVFSMVSVGFSTWTTITLSKEEITGMFVTDTTSKASGITVSKSEEFKYGEYFFVTDNDTSAIGKLIYSLEVTPSKLPASMKKINGSGYSFNMEAKLKMSDSVAIFSDKYVNGCKFNSAAVTPVYASDHSYLTFNFTVNTPNTTDVTSFDIEIDFNNSLVYEKKNEMKDKNFLFTVSKGAN